MEIPFTYTGFLNKRINPNLFSELLSVCSLNHNKLGAKKAYFAVLWSFLGVTYINPLNSKGTELISSLFFLVWWLQTALTINAQQTLVR